MSMLVPDITIPEKVMRSVSAYLRDAFLEKAGHVSALPRRFVPA